MKGLEDLTLDNKIIAILCNQWGDSGKGKYVDVFAEWADVIDRATGGPNAGHTVVFNGKKYVMHTLPSGIIHHDKVNILGNGMVIDVPELINEMDQLSAAGISFENLMISKDARVILDYHIEEDILRNKSDKNGGIGSTGRGIGPCYEDKANRTRSIKIGDLFNEDILVKKLFSEVMTEKYGRVMIEFEKVRNQILGTEELRTNMSEIIDKIKIYREKIRPFVKDTVEEVNNFRLSGKKILLEGAQGLMLSYEYGISPYVTSSDCSINGTAAGAGLSAQFVDLVLGIVKFPYMTRVGGGPFPTEFKLLNGKNDYFDRIKNIEDELIEHGVPFTSRPGRGIPAYDHADPKILSLINSNDVFKQGAGIRLAGEEYGATTGRLRRTGWTDLGLLKRAVKINGPNLILTKADVLRGANEFKLATGYNNVTYINNADELAKAQPNYLSFSGFNEDISGMRDFKDLPNSLQLSIKYLESYTGGNVRIISTSAEREDSIVK